MKISYILLCVVLLCAACNKEQILDKHFSPVRLTLKGLVLADTLDFVLRDSVVGFGANSYFTQQVNLFDVGDSIQLRTRSNGKLVGVITPAAAPFDQVRKLFYNGSTLSDNLPLTPVMNPENMGVRFRFFTGFQDFYGGPVDIELYDAYFDMDAFEVRYTALNTISNVTALFGDFIELPPLGVDHVYAFKVYKAGTKELPYKSMVHVEITDPAINYGMFDSFNPGRSELLSITPYGNETITVGDGYAVEDVAFIFR